MYNKTARGKKTMKEPLELELSSWNKKKHSMGKKS